MAKIKFQHQQQKEGLLKRVKRDRDELLVTRQREVEQLVLRSKIQVQEMGRRHKTEMKSLIDFMKYALSYRAPTQVEQNGGDAVSFVNDSCILQGSELSMIHDAS